MAFFKSRSQTPSSEDSAQDDAQSMDSLRKQARHRLIGATVLVVIAVVGFPMVFDTKPRELATDIRIDMPERESVRPSQAPVVPQPDKIAQSSSVQAESAASEKSTQESPVVVDTTSATAVPQQQIKSPDNKSPDSKNATADKAKAHTERDRAPTNTDSKPTDKADAAPHADRFIVQVGAYSDEAKVKEVRAKIEKAGFSTYVHVAKTKEGSRTRVRIGPFARKEEAQKVVNKLKSLNLTAAVLTL
jgi:DedD protein